MIFIMNVDIKLQLKESFKLCNIDAYLQKSIINKFYVPSHEPDLHYNDVPVDLLGDVLAQIKENDLQMSVVIKQISSRK